MTATALQFIAVGTACRSGRREVLQGKLGRGPTKGSGYLLKQADATRHGSPHHRQLKDRPMPTTHAITFNPDRTEEVPSTGREVVGATPPEPARGPIRPALSFDVRWQLDADTSPRTRSVPNAMANPAPSLAAPTAAPAAAQRELRPAGPVRRPHEAAGYLLKPGMPHPRLAPPPTAEPKPVTPMTLISALIIDLAERAARTGREMVGATPVGAGARPNHPPAIS